MNRETLREAIARRIDLVENVGPAHIEHDPESWRQCLPAAEAALAAIEAAGVRLVDFAALAEDGAAVEKVAEVFLTEARQLHEMMALAAPSFGERAQAQVALDSLRLEQTKAQARQYARAAIRALGE